MSVECGNQNPSALISPSTIYDCGSVSPVNLKYLAHGCKEILNNCPSSVCRLNVNVPRSVHVILSLLIHNLKVSQPLLSHTSDICKSALTPEDERISVICSIKQSNAPGI
jgi:hypothetical protein